MRDRDAIASGVVLFAGVLLVALFASHLYSALAWTWGGRGQGGANSDGYLIFSGPLGDVTLLSGGLLFLRHSVCNVGGRWPRGCWRLGHMVDGTPYHACHKHDPRRQHEGTITAEDIARAHRVSLHRIL